MTPLQWMLGSMVIISLIMFIVAISEEDSSVHFCQVLAVFFLLSVLFFAIAIMFNA